MSKNRKIQMLVAIALMVAVVAATVSAVTPPALSKADLTWPHRPEFQSISEKHVAPASYRSPLDECFDVPLRELAACQNTIQTSSFIPVTGLNGVEAYHQSERTLVDSAAEAKRYAIDSATRSYIAQGEAILAERNVINMAACSYMAKEKAMEIDSATRSYIAQGLAIEAERNATDSATRSYIAQGEAMLAERQAIDSATRSYIAQGEAILAERHALDSATRSYIAWGKAVLAALEAGVTCS